MTLQLDESQLETQFEATIARKDRIEPRDWMPDAYRATRKERGLLLMTILAVDR